PVCVGVPPSTPVDASSVRPAGSVPITLHVMAPLLPAWVKVALKAVPAVPVFVAGAVTVIVGQLIINVWLCVTVQLFASVALTEKLNEPGCVGVPLMSPPRLSINP